MHFIHRSTFRRESKYSRYRKCFSFFKVSIGILYLIFARVQNVGRVEGDGMGVVTPNVVMCILMSIVWFVEAKNTKSEYEFTHKQPLFYLLIPLCILAFWDPPVDHTVMGISMKFTLHNFIFSFAGLAECMMIGIFITIYLLTHDTYQSKAFKLQCMIGVFRGVENMGLALLYINSDRGAALAWLITHLPLLIISVVGYALTICEAKKTAKNLS